MPFARVLVVTSKGWPTARMDAASQGAVRRRMGSRYQNRIGEPSSSHSSYHDSLGRRDTHGRRLSGLSFFEIVCPDGRFRIHIPAGEIRNGLPPYTGYPPFEIDAKG